MTARRPNIPLRIRNLAGRLARLEANLEHQDERYRVLERMLENQRLQVLVAFGKLDHVNENLCALAFQIGQLLGRDRPCWFCGCSPRDEAPDATEQEHFHSTPPAEPPAAPDAGVSP